MGVTIKVPSHLRRVIDSDTVTVVEGQTVLECLSNFVRRYPGLKNTIFDSDNRVLLHWMIYVNDRPILRSSRLAYPVKSNDIISLFPIVAGG